MSNQPSNDAGIDGIPDGVLQLLSIPGIDPARFRDVTQAFGSLPDQGQVELANRLIEAREQYLYHKISLTHDTSRPGKLHNRLRDISRAAEKLLRLLHREGAEPEPWHTNTHHALTGALPELCRICAERRPNQIWDPPQGVSVLSAMLMDLVEVGARAQAVYPVRNPRRGGDRRKELPTPETNLIERLIGTYATLRRQYPKSGPPPAPGRPLYTFVQAAQSFIIAPRILPDRSSVTRSLESSYMDMKLPDHTTDKAIRGVFQRARTNSKNQLI